MYTQEEVRKIIESYKVTPAVGQKSRGVYAFVSMLMFSYDAEQGITQKMEIVGRGHKIKGRVVVYNAQGEQQITTPVIAIDTRKIEIGELMYHILADTPYNFMNIKESINVKWGTVTKEQLIMVFQILRDIAIGQTPVKEMYRNKNWFKKYVEIHKKM